MNESWFGKELKNSEVFRVVVPIWVYKDRKDSFETKNRKNTFLFFLNIHIYTYIPKQKKINKIQGC